MLERTLPALLTLLIVSGNPVPRSACHDVFCDVSYWKEGDYRAEEHQNVITQITCDIIAVSTRDCRICPCISCSSSHHPMSAQYRMYNQYLQPCIILYLPADRTNNAAPVIDFLPTVIGYISSAIPLIIHDMKPTSQEIGGRKYLYIAY